MVRPLPALPALPSEPPRLLGAALTRGGHGMHHEDMQTFLPMSRATPQHDQGQPSSSHHGWSDFP